MHRITQLVARSDWTLEVSFVEGEVLIYDVKPLLALEAFRELGDLPTFLAVRNGGYFVEWPNGADLSADTLRLEGIVA